MIKKRIIPILLHNNLNLIKGSHFNSWRRIGITRSAVRVYNARNVDEIIVLDITASNEGRGPDIELVQEIAKDCFVPLTVGGGISDLAMIREVLRNGADKVSLNTICYSNPDLIAEAVSVFGSQAIVASVDVLRTESGYVCVSNSGKKHQDISLEDHLRRLKRAGAGEYLVTVINDEGGMAGVDLTFYSRVKKIIEAPLIVSGGIGSIEHVCQAFKEVSPSGIGISSMFAFTETTPLEVKEALKGMGMAVRL